MNSQDIKETKLWSIIYPYDNWFNTDGEVKNQEAKVALHDFYKELLKNKPSIEYKRKGSWHMNYMSFLVKVKKAFKEEKYQRVCNELVSLMHYEPFFQGRIYYNVISLLESELDVGRD